MLSVDRSRQNTHDVIDPAFVDPQHYNFSLIVSPARDAGMDLSSFFAIDNHDAADPRLPAITAPIIRLAYGTLELTSTGKRTLPHQYHKDLSSGRIFRDREATCTGIANSYPTADKPGDMPQIQDQLDELRRRGVEVDLLYVDRYKGILGYVQAAWKLFLLSFQRRRYNLVHAYYGHCGLLARLQCRCPIVVTFLGSDLLSRRDRAIGKAVSKVADGVIVQSEEMKRIAERDDASIIPFGVKFEALRPYPMEDARRELGLALDEKLVLFPWNPARPVKRFDLIQEAVRIVQQRYDQVRLISVFDQPHETVAKYMNACDVMVLASEHEGSPMALREAMACNLPIVSVDVGDVRQIIENTEGCYLCKREPSDIAEKLGLVFERGGRTSGAVLSGRQMQLGALIRSCCFTIAYSGHTVGSAKEKHNASRHCKLWANLATWLENGL